MLVEVFCILLTLKATLFVGAEDVPGLEVSHATKYERIVEVSIVRRVL